MLYEMSGKVKKIGEVKTFASGFTKRDLIVIEDGPSKYPQTYCVEWKKDKTSLLDTVSVGDVVKISFGISGREWTDPKTGVVRYFTSLDGVKLAGGSGKAAKTPAPAVPDFGTMDEPDGSEMPF